MTGWPAICACGHDGYMHHLKWDGHGFGPDYFCKGGEGEHCDCDDYRPRATLSTTTS